MDAYRDRGATGFMRGCRLSRAWVCVPLAVVVAVLAVCALPAWCETPPGPPNAQPVADGGNPPSGPNTTPAQSAGAPAQSAGTPAQSAGAAVAQATGSVGAAFQIPNFGLSAGAMNVNRPGISTAVPVVIQQPGQGRPGHPDDVAINETGVVRANQILVGPNGSVELTVKEPGMSLMGGLGGPDRGPAGPGGGGGGGGGPPSKKEDVPGLDSSSSGKVKSGADSTKQKSTSFESNWDPAVARNRITRVRVFRGSVVVIDLAGVATRLGSGGEIRVPFVERKS